MSTETVLNEVRDAIASKNPLRISGAGTWMNAGRPVASAAALSLASDKGVVDYVPDDLTMTVRAGTTLSEIAQATRANGQWLPLDPFGGAQGTIGATFATASSGPLSHSSGLARDFILGLEIVTGKGDVIRSGGRVVKNVAGFDLMRLNCGAWGTLGVITQASLRLYALPKVDRTFALAVPAGANALAQFLELLRAAPLSSLALELVHSGAASKLGLPAKDCILARLGGNARLVDAQLATLGNIGATSEVGGDVWTKFTHADYSDYDIAARLSGFPANAASTWKAATLLADSSETAFVHSTFSRGVVRVALKGLKNSDALRARVGGPRIAFEKLPADLWSSVSPTVTGDRLSQSVKRAFDPHSLLNPGILG